MKNIIMSYINNLTIDQVNTFARNNNISLSKEELEFTYNYIKRNGSNLINNPNAFNINQYRNKFTNDNFNKVSLLINKYKIKYQSLL